MASKQRPYLIRAMHEWMLDNGFTPHIVVDAKRDGLSIPRDHVTEGKIVLNIGGSATHALVLGNDVITFEARFGGVARRVEVPVVAVLGIYARETGQGMIFTEDTAPPDPDTPDPGPDNVPGDSDGTRPKLTIVK
jgi:stringent starvation protein B